MSKQLIICTSIKELRDQLEPLRKAGKTLALVPTMGNLHDGHLQLVATALEQADYVVTSIFVNPLQFGPNEDLDNYPRTLEADQQKLNSAGCHFLFLPKVQEIYPQGQDNLSLVNVPQVSQGLCGASRPRHFDGVATVVAKLFNLVQPQIACFGQKDYQQLAVIQKMVRDLNFPINIVSVPTQRESSGLARSSRNGYLNATQLEQAANIYKVLKQTEQEILAGKTQPNQLNHLIDSARAHLAEHNLTPEYFEIRNLDLTPIRADAKDWVILVAARLGTTRLIDNLIVSRSSN